MADPSEPPPPTLGDLLAAVARRWPLVAVALVTGAAVGVGLAQAQPASYTATTLVQVAPVGPEEDAQSRLNLDTEAQVVTSTDTATAAAALMETTAPPAELAGQVSVQVPPNTTFLEISFTGPTPAQAQQGAHAFAQAYLTLREQAAQAELDERIDRLAEQVAALRAQGAAEPVLLPLLHEQLLLESEPVHGGDVRSPASLPQRPSSPNRTLYLASGLVAGLLAGLAAALLVHRRDRRVFRATDLPAELLGEVLAELPGSRPRTGVLGPETPLGRQFSRLRNVIRAGADSGGRAGEQQPGATAGVLLVCGVSAGTGAGFVTANLAAAFARAGERVVVIGGDPGSSLFEALGVAGGPAVGLSDVLAGRLAPAEAAVVSPVADRVSVLAPGPVDHQAELSVGEMTGVVLRLAAGVDRVIVESAPVSTSIDAQALGVLASALLLVVERQRTTGDAVSAAVRDFQQVRAPFAGIVLVPPADRRRRAAPRRVAPAGQERPRPPQWTEPAAPREPDDTVVFGRVGPTAPRAGYGRVPGRRAPGDRGGP